MEEKLEKAIADDAKATRIEETLQETAARSTGRHTTLLALPSADYSTLDASRAKLSLSAQGGCKHTLADAKQRDRELSRGVAKDASWISTSMWQEFGQRQCFNRAKIKAWTDYNIAHSGAKAELVGRDVVTSFLQPRERTARQTTAEETVGHLVDKEAYLRAALSHRRAQEAGVLEDQRRVNLAAVATSLVAASDTRAVTLRTLRELTVKEKSTRDTLRQQELVGRIAVCGAFPEVWR